MANEESQVSVDADAQAVCHSFDRIADAFDRHGGAIARAGDEVGRALALVASAIDDQTKQREMSDAALRQTFSDFLAGARSLLSPPITAVAPPETAAAVPQVEIPPGVRLIEADPRRLVMLEDVARKADRLSDYFTGNYEVKRTLPITGTVDSGVIFHDRLTALRAALVRLWALPSGFHEHFPPPSSPDDGLDFACETCGISDPHGPLKAHQAASHRADGHVILRRHLDRGSNRVDWRREEL